MTTRPDRETVRAAIERQVCPWCGAGPFRSLAHHTRQCHGVTADDLRVLAGLAQREPTCSSEASETHASVALDGWRAGALRSHYDEVVDEIEERTARMGEMYADGRMVKEIAAEMGLSTFTVRLSLRGLVDDARVKGSPRWRQPTTHCKWGHEYTPENTYVQPSTGGRQCLACRRERKARRAT